VVHDEHHGRGVGHFFQRLGIDKTQAHAVQALRDLAADPVAEAEVQVGVEGRHDLARIVLDRLEHRGHRYLVLRGILLDSRLHLRISDEAVDQDLAARALERADADAQARRHLFEHHIGASGHEPAQRGHEQLFISCPGGERADQHCQPQRHRDQFCPPRFTCGQVYTVRTCRKARSGR
jgi:hypothetical protein